MLTVWPDIAAALHPHDHPTPSTWQSSYETKFAIARLLQPTSIFEIGVRTGYSALAFLRAVPHARYLGIDANVNTHGGMHGGIHHARRLLEPYNAEVHELSSAEYAANLESSHSKFDFDLIHVDGDHSLAGCEFDLQLALRLGIRNLLVDDYAGIDEVRVACDHFGETHVNQFTRIVIQDGHNGAALFTGIDPTRQQFKAQMILGKG